MRRPGVQAADINQHTELTCQDTHTQKKNPGFYLVLYLLLKKKLWYIFFNNDNKKMADHLFRVL